MKNKKDLVVKNDETITPDVILGSRVSHGRDLKTGEEINVSDGDKDYKKEIEAIPENERVELVHFTIMPKNRATGIVKEVVIDRRGIDDNKLAMILSNSELSDEQKNSQLSLYLFEKGKESSSFLVDLFASKGKFFKGAHEFKSQIRFDFTVFMNTFCEYLEEKSQSMIDVLLPSENAVELEKKAFDFLKEHEGTKLSEFVRTVTNGDAMSAATDLIRRALVEQTIRDISEAQLIRKRIAELAKNREAEKGKGVHLSPDGQVENNENERSNK